MTATVSKISDALPSCCKILSGSGAMEVSR